MGSHLSAWLKQSDTEGFLMAVALFLAIGFACLIAWLFRRSPKNKALPELDAMHSAYLIGGPLRAMELALFFLARDAWLRHNGRGFFFSRFADVPEDLPPIERELLLRLAASQGMSAADLFRIELQSLGPVEAALVRQGLILPAADEQLSLWLALLPLGVYVLFDFVRLVLEAQHGPYPKILLLTGVIGAAAFFKLKNGFQRQSEAGEALIRQIRAQVAARPRPGGSAREMNDAPFDLLWDIKDDVMLKGLQSLAGSVFAPLAAWVDASEARGKEPGTPAESAEAMHTSQDSVEKKAQDEA